MRRLLLGLCLLLALAALPARAAPLQVVASFSVLGDIVRQVGGDRIELRVLVGPDGDAHQFEPTPADARALAAADLVFVNGLGLEHWMARLITAAGYGGPVVVATQGIKPRIATEGDEAGQPDPHAWQDLANGQVYVKNVAAALTARDPAGAAAYAANAGRLAAELATLDQWVRAEIGAVPAAKRRVITTHDAFGYFGAAYGVTFLAAEGISTDSEPSAAAVAKLIEQARAEHIRALFIENLGDPRLVEMIAHETGATLGGSLFSDALSPPDGPAPTYPAMFRNNVPKLKAAMLLN
ncbi:MAG: zinc ABC transporter substrate-binding protein [Dongiaceae bacterium]